MTDPPAFFSPGSRIRAGVAVLVVVLGLTYGQWWSANESIKTLRAIEQHRQPGDSAAYVSAVYHASRARVTIEGRWSATGYGTLGVAGTLIGLALVLSARPRRAERVA